MGPPGLNPGGGRCPEPPGADGPAPPCPPGLLGVSGFELLGADARELPELLSDDEELLVDELLSEDAAEATAAGGAMSSTAATPAQIAPRRTRNADAFCM
ncbi:MAG: hypothetical protein J2P18_04850 [Nocardia sp.]|nr:hypothetical protein [Nocardia sp.]